MRYFGTILLVFVLIAPMACKNNERGTDAEMAPNSPPSERGPDLGLPIRILESPTENWVTLDTLSANTGKQMTLGNVYLNRVSRAMYATTFGFLVEGDFPDGCSSLRSMSLTFEDDVVLIDARSQRDASAMCTQALVPFSYFAPAADDDAYQQAKRWKFGDVAATIE
jgi:hypothetical protein